MCILGLRESLEKRLPNQEPLFAIKPPNAGPEEHPDDPNAVVKVVLDRVPDTSDGPPKTERVNESEPGEFPTFARLLDWRINEYISVTQIPTGNAEDFANYRVDLLNHIVGRDT